MHWLEEFEDVVNKVKNPDFRSKKGNSGWNTS